MNDTIPQDIEDRLLRPMGPIKDMLKDSKDAHYIKNFLKLYMAKPCFRNRKQLRETMSRTKPINASDNVDDPT